MALGGQPSTIYRVQWTGSTAQVRLRGPVDQRTVPDLRSVLFDIIEACPGRIELEVSGVTWIDRTGLGFVLEATRRARRYEITMTVAGADDRMRRLLSRLRLGSLMTHERVPAAGVAAEAGDRAES